MGYLNTLSLYYKLPFYLKCLIASYRGMNLKRNRFVNRDNYIREIQERDFWDKNKVKVYQDNLIREMLGYCIKNVPYYRNYNNTHSSDSNWNPLKLSNWPILEKDIIRKNPELFISDEFNKEDLVNIATSGTSGKPMSFWFTKDALSHWYALYEYRIKMWNGVSDKDNWANFGGQLVCEIGRRSHPIGLRIMP